MWEVEEIFIAAMLMNQYNQLNRNQVSETLNLKEDFQWLCQEGKFAAVEVALKRGVDVNSIHAETDQTGLMAAVRRHENDIVKLLLQQSGVNVTWESAQGSSAFTVAVEGWLFFHHLCY